MGPAESAVWAMHGNVSATSSVRRSRAHLLAELNCHIVNTIEAERKTLARELHDEMGATLALISLELAQLEVTAACSSVPVGVAARVATIRQLLESMYQYKHRVIAGLRPPLLDELGLEEAVRAYAGTFARQSGIRVIVRILGPLPRLGEDARLTIFRAVQESLTNCAKHARATQVDIHMRRAQRRILVVVADNGVGFASADKRAEGFGLLGLRERLQVLGGHLSVESRRAGSGTRVECALPLAGNDPA